MIYLVRDDRKKIIPMQVCQSINKERKIKVENYRNIEDKRNSILGFLLLKYGLKHEYGINLQMLEWNYTKYGKPYFSEYPNIFFNISHSGEFIVCAIDQEKIGIDIQKIIDSKFLGVADVVCSINEKEKILYSIKPEKILTRYWALKESFIKAIGTGMTDTMYNINFANKDEKFFEYKNKYFSVFEKYDCVLSVCYSKKKSLNIKEVTIEELI